MGLLQKIFSFFKKTNKENNEVESVYGFGADEVKNDKSKVFEEFHSIWDHLSLRENSQVYFILNVVGFEEWVSMDEILRRIEELFGVKFKNKRSLYPYVKTMVDLNLMESLSVGDKMKWRKKEILIKIKKKKKKKELELLTN